MSVAVQEVGFWSAMALKGKVLRIASSQGRVFKSNGEVEIVAVQVCAQDLVSEVTSQRLSWSMKSGRCAGRSMELPLVYGLGCVEHCGSNLRVSGLLFAQSVRVPAKMVTLPACVLKGKFSLENCRSLASCWDSVSTTDLRTLTQVGVEVVERRVCGASRFVFVNSSTRSKAHCRWTETGTYVDPFRS